MLNQEYTAYKIWESEQRLRELQLAREAERSDGKALPRRSNLTTLLIAMYANLFKS